MDMHQVAHLKTHKCFFHNQADGIRLKGFLFSFLNLLLRQHVSVSSNPEATCDWQYQKSEHDNVFQAYDLFEFSLKYIIVSECARIAFVE